MKTGVVDVGGGLRGIYAAGVFDRCMEDGVLFDLGIGVSAGSANIMAYIAGQKKRNYVFYTEYTQRKEYMSAKNFLLKHSYLDLDYVYGTLTNSDGEYPLDYEAFMKCPMEYIAVATDARTGKPKYFGKKDTRQDDYSILKASCAIPGVCHPYKVDGVPYYDGALGDTIPVKKALSMGCGKVVLVLTKPRDTIREPGKDNFFAKMIGGRYPDAALRLRHRAQQYNAGVAFTKRLEQEGKALIVAPEDTCGVDTLTKDPQKLKLLYQRGYEDGAAIAPFVRAK